MFNKIKKDKNIIIYRNGSILKKLSFLFFIKNFFLVSCPTTFYNIPFLQSIVSSSYSLKNKAFYCTQTFFHIFSFIYNIHFFRGIFKNQTFYFYKFFISKKNMLGFFYFFLKFMNRKFLRFNFHKFVSTFFIGIGYKVYIFNNYLYLRLGFSKMLKIKIPNSIFVFIRKRNMLRLISSNYQSLNSFNILLKNLRKFDKYKGKGIFSLGNFNDVKLKPGKKQQFF